MSGRISLLGTPLGNLGDFSPRAIETMRSLDILYCEDTRHTGKLTSHFGIAVPLRPLHDDSPAQHWIEAVKNAQSGMHIGYASDAGMPGVSDPGRRLLRAAWDAGITPVVIPGPSAVTTLTAYCPFISGEFVFAGFFPRKESERKEFVGSLRCSARPVLFFEAPSRLHRALDLLCAELEPGRELLIGRELTKLHEQVVLFSAEMWSETKERIPALGEFTVAVSAAPATEQPLDEAVALAALDRLTKAGFSRKDASRALASVWELPANRLKALGYSAQDPS